MGGQFNCGGENLDRDPLNDVNASFYNDELR